MGEVIRSDVAVDVGNLAMPLPCFDGQFDIFRARFDLAGIWLKAIPESEAPSNPPRSEFRVACSFTKKGMYETIPPLSAWAPIRSAHSGSSVINADVHPHRATVMKLGLIESIYVNCTINGVNY
jgi:hypothetical protein